MTEDPNASDPEHEAHDSPREPNILAAQSLPSQAIAESGLRASEMVRAAYPPGMLAFDRSITEAADLWRRRLIGAEDFAKSAGSIGASVSEAVAARQTLMSSSMTSLRLAGLETRLEITGVAEQLARLTREIGEPYRIFARQLELTNKILADGLRSAAVTAAIEWGQRYRELNERQRQLHAELRSDGWPVAPSWPMSRPARLVALRRAEGKRALDRAVCVIYSANDYRELRMVVDSCMDEPSFKSRRAIIREALDLHIAGRYRSSIPTLLPHVEGIAVDVFAPGSRTSDPRKLYEAGGDPDGVERLLAEGLVAVFDLLYVWTSFATVSPRTRRLNRHLILHGRTVSYGSEANSLKVFLALDLLASEARAKRDYEAGRIVA